jgi:hypothetical protein
MSRNFGEFKIRKTHSNHDAYRRIILGDKPIYYSSRNTIKNEYSPIFIERKALMFALGRERANECALDRRCERERREREPARRIK